MTCPNLSPAFRWTIRKLEAIALWLRLQIGACDERSAHHGESIAYYQYVEREDERSKGALWL